MMIDEKNVQNRILDFFIASSDFNGILLSDISAEFGVPWSDIREVIYKFCPFAENFYEIANFLTAIYGGIA
jgi:hypothetical protein